MASQCIKASLSPGYIWPGQNLQPPVRPNSLKGVSEAHTVFELYKKGALLACSLL